MILLFILFLFTSAMAFVSRRADVVRSVAFAMGIINSLVGFFLFIGPMISQNETLATGFLRIDRFSAFMGLLIILVYGFAMISSHRFIAEETRQGIMDIKQTRLYFFLLPIFALAMLTVVVTDNLAMLWLSLEATTLATTPLVALYKKDGSLEAAWKYIILCSLGISLGLLGVLMISYSGITSGMSRSESLSLSLLMGNAPHLVPATMQWGFVFAFIGLGTKVGFFPLHAWLPDAHGRTPSPVSAMLSGILLNVALYAIIKIKF